MKDFPVVHGNAARIVFLDLQIDARNICLDLALDRVLRVTHIIDKVLPVLNQVAPLLRHHLANKVHLRRIPVLKFVADESYDTADRMSRLFSSIQTDG